MRLFLFLSIFTILSALAAVWLLEGLRTPSESNCDTIIDLFVVLDSSGSIGVNALEEAKNALVNLVSMLDIGPKKAQVCVITYGQVVETSISCHNTPISEFTKTKLIQRIKTILYMNGDCTATGDALQVARHLYDKNCRSLKEGTSRVALVLADGYSNCGTKFRPEADIFFSKNKASIFAIGVGKGIHNAELHLIASEKRHVMHVNNYIDLIAAMNIITIHTCGIPGFVLRNVKVETSASTNRGFIEIIANVHPGPDSGQNVQFQTRGSELYYMEYIEQNTSRFYFSVYVVQWFDRSRSNLRLELCVALYQKMPSYSTLISLFAPSTGDASKNSFVYNVTSYNNVELLLGITASQLKAIMPRCKHPEYLRHINNAMREGSINTCARKAAFLAQIAHESGELVYMEELASGAAYEGRKDLGNTEKGDGKRFKGRGPIQLTGRANYKAAGKALHLDLINHPEQVKTPEVGFRTSVWFWTTRKLNVLADPNTLASFRSITRRINGGSVGQVDREKYWARAKKTLGC
ncbi:hypothetical protein I4U23_019918 [Adineta vaga]|nr:hypothetical protein I4U23_019918 [Adineta vaga]